MQTNEETTIPSNSSLPQPNEEMVTPQDAPSKKTKLSYILLGVFITLIVIGVGGFFIGKFLRVPSSVLRSPSALQVSPTPTTTDNFLQSGLSGIPLERLEIDDFPDFKTIRGVVHYQDKVWMSGGGSLVEFDTSNNSVTRYSDPQVVNCDDNLAVVGNHLFVPCRSLTSYSDEPGSDSPPYGIYKVNLETNQVDYVYTDKDGLLNRENYKIYSDGNYVWVATFNGVARINSLTDEIEFFQQELKINATKFGIASILPDKNYVWVIVNAHAYSKGGLALFNKMTQEWKAFGPEELRDDGRYERVDVEFSFGRYALKLIPGGVRVGFREKEPDFSGDILVEKEYNYSTGAWVKANSMPITGKHFETGRQQLAETYSITSEYGEKDQNGFTQLFIGEKSQPRYTINGRDFLSISEVISNKRYLITSASLDYINSSSQFPEIILNFGRDVDPGFIDSDVRMYLVDNAEILIVIDPNVEMSAYDGSVSLAGVAKIWVVDTNSNQVLKEYQSDQQFAWRQDIDFNARQDGDKIFLTNQSGNQKIIEYDRKNNSLSILDKKIKQDS